MTPPAAVTALMQEISQTLDAAFAGLDHWFDEPAALRQYQPKNGGWRIDQILEHTALTNHFLLILIDKGAAKALKNVHGLNLAQELATYQFHRAKLDEIGQHRAFAWIRPAHMEPQGYKTSAEVRAQLQTQLQHCQQVLTRLPNGEGALFKTTMTVNDLGRIDVYEYLYFLAKHAERHLMQMQRNAAEFREQL